jgi:hypothetical protein
LLSNIFSIALCIRLGPSHPFSPWGVTYICNQPLDLIGIHFLCCVHGGEKMFSWPLREKWDFMSHKNRPMSFHTLSNWNCVISRWCSHINWHCHWWPIRIDLVSWVAIFCGVVAIVVI